MSGPRSRPGRKPSSARNLFGTPEEVDNRTNTLYGWTPDTTAPSFKQIEPQSGSGQSVNRATPDHKSGDFKYSGGTGRP